MSGRTIGTIVGATLSIFFPGAGPLLMTIGGIIGGALKPDKIQGVQLDDLPLQSSVSGNPRAIVDGTSPVKGTRIICQSEIRIVTEETQQGKGGGPVVENDVAYQDFTIEVCESSELRGTKVEAIVAVWQDGVLVYDVRPNPLISAADSAKWKEGVTFYYGEETQLPDPTEESIYGVGNVPAYRGTCRMVLANRKISPRNSIGSFEVLVSKCGVMAPGQMLVTGQSKEGQSAIWCKAPATGSPTFEIIDPATGADMEAAIPGFGAGRFVVLATDDARASLDLESFAAITADTDGQPADQIVGGSAGWLGRSSIAPGVASHEFVRGSSSPSNLVNFTPTAPYSNGGGTWDMSNARHIFKAGSYYFANYDRNLYRATDPGGPWETLHDQFSIVAAGQNPNGACIVQYFDGVKLGDRTYFACGFEFSQAFRRYQVRYSEDDGVTLPDANIIYDVAEAVDNRSPIQLVVVGETIVAYCYGGGVRTLADDFAAWIDTGLVGPTAVSQEFTPGGRRIAPANGNVYVIGFGPTDGDKCAVSVDGGLTFPLVVTMPIRSAIGIAASGGAADVFAGAQLPDAPGHYIDPLTGLVTGPSPGAAEMCGTTLDNVVSLITRLSNIPDAQVDVTELANVSVRGITIQTHDNGKKILEPITQTWFFDLPEFDSKLRAHLRGQAVADVVIDVADLLDTGDEDDDWRRGQQVNFPRKHHLGYMSLDLDYIETSAVAERTSPDVRVVGETRIGSVGVHSTTEATQIADIQMKVLWTEREGNRKIPLPLKYIRIVGGSIVMLENRRWRVDSYRIDNGAFYIEAALYDRASAYSSTAIGASPQPPTPPPSTVRGPTVSALINMPVAVDANDKAGLAWAATGPSEGWIGAQLQLQRSGIWENGPILTTPCTMGVLTAPLASASRYGLDTTNVLTVKLYPGARDLDSTTMEGLLEERNAFAIVRPDGTCEVMQFRTATETAPGEYTLTGLMRGRLDTAPAEHASGAMFVLLDSAVRFVALKPEDLGKTLTFRAVSLGTDPDANATQTVTMTTIESLREWQPYNVVVTEDGSGGYCLEWIGRGRLGTSRTPVHSQWFDGYRVVITVGSQTLDLDTTEQSLCVGASTLHAAFGARFGVPQFSVVARSRVATNDDDFDSPPGQPPTPDANYPAVIIGGPTDGFVGEPIFDPLGPTSGSPFQAYGGLWEELFKGEIVANVTAQSDRPGQGAVFGIPLTAETRNAATELIPSGPLVTGGPFLITDSVTIAAKPTFALMDESLLSRGNPVATAATGYPRATKIVPPGGFGHMRSRAGFSTGQRRCVITIAGLPAGGSIAVGVHAGSAASALSYGVAGHFTYKATANGAYAIETDATTGAITIKLVGGGVLATGTLPLTYAYDGKYRFAWNVVDPAPGAQVHTNMGNEAWPDTPTAGYGGVPNEATIVPCGFDAVVGAANGYKLRGERSLTDASLGGSGWGVLAYAAFGKSTGKWRIGISADTGSRAGFCKAGHSGLLGASDSPDSIGFTDTRNPTGYVIETSFGGLHNRIVVPQMAYYTRSLVRFAFDVDAGTLAIYVCFEHETDYQLLTTISGIPAGTWLPAINGRAQLTPELPGPATYNDWTITR